MVVVIFLILSQYIFITIRKLSLEILIIKPKISLETMKGKDTLLKPFPRRKKNELYFLEFRGLGDEDALNG